MNNTTIVSQTSKEKGDLDWLPILVFLSPMIFYFFVYLYKSIEYRISQCCIDKPNKKNKLFCKLIKKYNQHKDISLEIISNKTNFHKIENSIQQLNFLLN